MAYLILKLLFLTPVVEGIMAPLVFIFLGKKVGPLLFYIKCRNELVQEMTYLDTWKYKKIRYLEEKDKFKELLREEYIKSFKEASKKLRNKSVFFVTNKWVFKNVLLPLEKEGVLKAFPLEIRIKAQAVEKLVFISSIYIYRHLFDRKFWDKIFRKEQVTKFLIKFL